VAGAARIDRPAEPLRQQERQLELRLGQTASRGCTLQFTRGREVLVYALAAEARQAEHVQSLRLARLRGGKQEPHAFVIQALCAPEDLAKQDCGLRRTLAGGETHELEGRFRILSTIRKHRGGRHERGVRTAASRRLVQRTKAIPL
jgi:hypothetical protein